MPEFPGARGLKARLSSLGARAVLMSGSGPSVFGIFDTPEAAEAARDTLASEGVRAFVAASA